MDIYDVSEDCTRPVLRSSLPVGILGYEGNFSPDGNTLYISSTGAPSITAIDVSNPDVPVILWRGEFRFHGLTISDDGNRIRPGAERDLVLRRGQGLLRRPDHERRLAGWVMRED